MSDRIIRNIDFTIDIFRTGSRGGMQTGNVESGVIVIHEPSGLGCVSKNLRSQHKNKEQALNNLKDILRSEGWS